jgi:hypothetical protein
MTTLKLTEQMRVEATFGGDPPVVTVEVKPTVYTFTPGQLRAVAKALTHMADKREQQGWTYGELERE